ncbi:hypothetical protein, partial [Leptotrichia hofstadii]
LNKDKLKRAIIFLFYDKDGIVDDYIPTLFQGLKGFYDKLCFVANGKLSEEGKENSRIMLQIFWSEKIKDLMFGDTRLD